MVGYAVNLLPTLRCEPLPRTIEVQDLQSSIPLNFGTPEFTRAAETVKGLCTNKHGDPPLFWSVSQELQYWCYNKDTPSCNPSGNATNATEPVQSWGMAAAPNRPAACGDDVTTRKPTPEASVSRDIGRGPRFQPFFPTF